MENLLEGARFLHIRELLIDVCWDHQPISLNQTSKSAYNYYEARASARASTPYEE